MTTKIQKGQANTLILTLRECQIESLPENNYLFVITREQTLEEVGKLYLENISDHRDRYDEFVLVDPDDVDFKVVGDYQYNVYQMPDGGSLDETEGNHLEVGKIKVIEAETIVSYEAEATGRIYEH